MGLFPVLWFKLLQCGFFLSMGWSSSATDCSKEGSLQSHRSQWKTVLQCGLLSSWVHRSCQEPAAVQALHVATSSFRTHPPTLMWNSPQTAGGCLLRGHSPPLHGLHHRMQGNLCSGAWSNSSLSFFTGLSACKGASLSYSHLAVVVKFSIFS